jgi:hypothetical protein
MVASSDLFDGEIFGDELIDIYDSHNVSDGGTFQCIGFLPYSNRTLVLNKH